MDSTTVKTKDDPDAMAAEYVRWLGDEGFLDTLDPDDVDEFAGDFLREVNRG